MTICLSKESKLKEENVALLFDKNAHSYVSRTLLHIHHFYEASYNDIAQPLSYIMIVLIETLQDCYVLGIIFNKSGYLTSTIMGIN